MTALAATLLYMHVVWVTPALEPVYAAHYRRAPYGPELRALEQAEQLEHAAELAGVPIELLAAVAQDESGLDDDRVSRCGARGRMQLLPASRWGRAWLEACEERPRACEALNVLWGAYALRDALDACGGDPHLALGFYRAGRCVAGPRGAATIELATWIAHAMEVR